MEIDLILFSVGLILFSVGMIMTLDGILGLIKLFAWQRQYKKEQALYEREDKKDG